MNTMNSPRPASLSKLWEQKVYGNALWYSVEGWGRTYVISQYLAFLFWGLPGMTELETLPDSVTFLILVAGALIPPVLVALSQRKGKRLTTLKRALAVAAAYQAILWALLGLIFLVVRTLPNDESVFLMLPLVFVPYLAWWPIGTFARWRLSSLRRGYEKRIVDALKAVPGAEVGKPSRTQDLTTFWITCGRRSIFAALSYEIVIPETNGRWKGKLPPRAAQYVDYKGHDTVILLDRPTGSSAVFPAGKRTYVLSGGFDAPERFVGQIAFLCKQAAREAEEIEIGRSAERLATESLRALLPEGWQVYTSLWLPELQGEVDLVVMASDKRIWIIEVKSYAGPVTYQDGELWRGDEQWEGVMDQLRKQMLTARAPVVLWQPRANEEFDHPKRLEGEIYHHRGNPKGLVKLLTEA